MKTNKLLIMVASLVLTLTLFGCASTDQPRSVGTYEESKTEDKVEKSIFQVGEKVELNNVITTLVGVEENTGSTFNKPTEGNVFLICEFEIENNSNEELAISSLMSFDAYCDDYSTNLSLTAIVSSDKNQLDGTVAPGKKMKGIVGYEVPNDWEKIEIVFSPDFWSRKDITFIANH